MSPASEAGRDHVSVVSYVRDVRGVGGAGGEDVQLSPAARRLFPYSVECKAHKAFAFYKIMEQAAANSPKGSEPLVIIKGDRKKPLAVVDAEHFFKLTNRGEK